MNEEKAIQFFVLQSLQHARSLPLAEARAFLKGLLCIGGDQREVDVLRETYHELVQLETHIEALQMRLTLK